MSPRWQRTLTWVATGGYVVPLAIVLGEWCNHRYYRKARQ